MELTLFERGANTNSLGSDVKKCQLSKQNFKNNWKQSKESNTVINNYIKMKKFIIFLLLLNLISCRVKYENSDLKNKSCFEKVNKNVYFKLH